MTLRKILMLLGVCGIALTANAQEQKNDTVKVALAKTSQVIFTIKDRSDLEILKHYDFQQMFNDIIQRLEKDGVAIVAVDSAANTVTLADESTKEDWSTRENEDDDSDRHDDDDDGESDHEEWDWNHGYRRWGKSWQSFNFDLGTNNWLSSGKFPDSNNEIYAVRPWGSWYLALNSTQRSRIGKNFFLEWGGGISWYSFKFQNDAAMLVKNDDGVVFMEDTRDVNHIKSKLSVTYLNVSLIPVIDFGDRSRRPRVWNNYGNSFRIGLGPYVGYRISSRTKLVYNDDGREKDKNRDGFYLNNLRYGARLQLGFRATDFFFNYDMNELFASGKGPKLNAFSFGVIF